MNLRITSFATRICIYIITMIIIVFGITLGVYYHLSRIRIIKSSMEIAYGNLNNMASRVEAQLNSVSHSIDATAWLLQVSSDDTLRIKEVLIHNIQNNSVIMGSSLAFVPKAEQAPVMYYSSRSYMGVGFENVDLTKYNYAGMDWFLIPKLLGKGYWSEPYFDEGVGNEVMSTYSLPLRNKEGQIFAIYTADISLDQFTDQVEKLIPLEDSYSFLLSRNGYYLTHRNKERIMSETIFSNAFGRNNKDYEVIGREMLAGNTGGQEFVNDGNRSYAIYAPITSVGWSICSVVSEDILLASLTSLMSNILKIFFAAIIAFFLFTFLLVRRLVRPIEGFASTARQIAQGDFNASLPSVRLHDEMKDLYNAFSYMKESLNSYIEDLKTTTATKERIESELSIAHDIQMGMIPKIFPPFPERADVDLHAILKPAKEVGGDLYDFYIQNEQLFFVIGDVSGKGVPASLLMAVTRSLFRSVSGYLTSPCDIVRSMNDSISEQNEANMFVTLFVGVLDLQTGLLTFCNAGHNPPVVISKEGEVSYMKVKNNLPIGLLEGFVYANESIVLEPETKLFTYTDGVVEAEDVEKELYTESKLLKTLAINHKLGVRRMVNCVVDSVAEHVLEAEPSDDLTILVLNYKK